MVGSDLTAPLGMNKRRGLRRLPLGVFGTAIITVLLTTGFIWIGVVDDPNGGEPMATIKLSSALDGVAHSDIEIVSLPDRNGIAGDDAGDGPARRQLQGLDGEIILPPSAGFTNQAVSNGNGPAPLAQLSRSASLAGVSQGFAGTALSSDPAPALIENSPFGRLPKVSPDGVRPLDVYARRPNPAALAQAQIAIVVGGVGLNSEMTVKAIEDLPSDITLALSPYGDDIDSWMESARLSGHELLLQAPMEPFDYPDNDAGPQSLLTGLKPQQNLQRLSWIMAQTTNYVGLVNFMGDRFTSHDERMAEFLTEVNRRGLMYLDDGNAPRSKAGQLASQIGVPFVKADMVLDASLSDEAIGTQLLELETMARQRGIAVASATAFPVTLNALEAWANRLEERGLSLVPISHVLTTVN